MSDPRRSGQEGDARSGRGDRGVRVAATDLAILTAFCRPFFERQRRFPCPAPNNKILEELRESGIYLDLDALRGHLRNLYAKFGVDDDLTATEKRAQLAELVYENNVIPGWGPDHEPVEPSSSPQAPSDTPASVTATPAERAAGDRSPDEPPSTSRLEKLRGRHVRAAAGSVALLVGVAALLAVSLAGGDEATKRPTSGGGSSVHPSAMTNARGTVTYCTGKDVVASRDGRSHQHQAAVDAFNERFGPRLHATLHQFSDDATQQYEQFGRLQRARSGDCDVFYSDVIWTADFANAKWLSDLSTYARPRLTRFVPAMRDAAVFDGRVWGIPKQADAALLYYNTRSVKRPPETWQQLYEQAAPRKRFRYQGLDYEGLTVDFLEIAYAIGATEIVTRDRKANINQPKALLALQFMVDGIRQGAVPREIVNQTEEHSLRAFGRGRADFMRNWPYAYAALQDPVEYPKVAGDVGVAPLPRWNDRAPVSVLGGHVLVVSAFSDNPAAALKLVDFLSSADVLKRDAAEFSLAPARQDLWDDPEVQKALPAFSDLKSAIFDAKSRPVTPNYQAVSAAISKNVNRALRGQPPDEALELANDEMQRALDEAFRGR